MRINEIKSGVGTITIDGNEMIILIDGLNRLQYDDPHTRESNVRARLLNDMTGLYSISVYGKMPQIKHKPIEGEGSDADVDSGIDTVGGGNN